MSNFLVISCKPCVKSYNQYGPFFIRLRDCCHFKITCEIVTVLGSQLWLEEKIII